MPRGHSGSVQILSLSWVAKTFFGIIWMVGEFRLHLVFPLDSARYFPLPEHLEAASKIVVELASCQK